MSSHCEVHEPALRLYLDVGAVCRKVHLHHKTGDVPAAVDAVQLWAKCQVIEVHCTLSGAHCQITRIWTEPVSETLMTTCF